jgi:hypothetical protein
VWPVVVFAAVPGGLLLVAVCIHLWSGVWDRPGLASVAGMVAWAAAGLLLIGALLVWGGRLPTLKSLVRPLDMGAWQGPVLSLVLMAALAIPLGGETGPGAETGRDNSPSRALVYLPALALTAVVLVRVSSSNSGAFGADWVTPLRFSIAVCAGLGARALGQALREMAAGSRCVDWPRELTLGLLTLVAGSATLVSLWRRGVVWGGSDPALRGGLASAWLVWSADWLAPRRRPRLRALLTSTAALLLIAVAIGEA